MQCSTIVRTTFGDKGILPLYRGCSRPPVHLTDEELWVDFFLNLRIERGCKKKDVNFKRNVLFTIHRRYPKQRYLLKLARYLPSDCDCLAHKLLVELNNYQYSIKFLIAYNCKLYEKLNSVTVFEGDSKTHLSIATTTMCREGTTPFPRLLHFTLDTYLIMLRVKERGIKYYFFSLWYESTLDWIPVSQAIGEHSTL